MKINLFNSTIIKIKINYKKKKDLILSIEREYSKNPHKIPKKWNCDIHSTFDENYLTIPEDLINLLEVVSIKSISHLFTFPGNLGITNIWYNVCNKSQFQEPHSHAGSLFSGCYYLKFNKNLHHPTTFYNPNFGLISTLMKDKTYFQQRIPCQEDDLLIFPSNLMHSTEGIIHNNQDTNNLRITVSFNIVDTFLYYQEKNLNRKLIKYT
jgi:hypothetical protein